VTRQLNGWAQIWLGSYLCLNLQVSWISRLSANTLAPVFNTLTSLHIPSLCSSACPYKMHNNHVINHQIANPRQPPHILLCSHKPLHITVLRCSNQTLDTPHTHLLRPLLFPLFICCSALIRCGAEYLFREDERVRALITICNIDGPPGKISCKPCSELGRKRSALSRRTAA
jgi:hypothetical protein